MVFKKLGLGLLCLLAVGCGNVRPPQSVSVDYNRAFAESRDEILLLNILRAAGREPLQFSTMGTVTGSGTRGQASITLPFSNAIAEGAAGAFSLSPSLQLADANPNLSIIPLSDREFTLGILSPISPSILSHFLNQGRDAEFLLPLVVGGVQCPGGQVVLNRGDYRRESFTRFSEMFAAAAAGGITIEERRRDGERRQLRLPTKDVLPLLQNGPGPGRRIVGISAEQDHTTVDVQDFSSQWVIRRNDGAPPFDFAKVCPAAPAAAQRSEDQGIVLINDTGDHEPRLSGQGTGVLLLRSVESIIYYLGETQRIWIDHELQRCALRDVRAPATPSYPTYLAHQSGNPTPVHRVLFRVRVGCAEDAVPLHTAISTSFHGRRFYVPILDGVNDPDRTLKTLSFLSELIALQMSQALIQSSTPTIAIQR